MASRTLRLPRPARRRLTTMVVTAAIGLLTFPSLVAASAPVRTSDVAHMTDPAPMSVSGATLDFNVLYSTLIGARADVSYHSPTGTFTGVEGYAVMDGSRLTGEFALFDQATGEFAAFAFYDFEFTPAGEVEQSEQVTRDGNHRTVTTFTSQPMQVSGTVTMPDGIVFQLAGEDGTRATADSWATDPRSTILDGTETFIEAGWTVGEMPVTFRANVTALDSAGVVFLDAPDGTEVIGAAAPALVDDRMTASFTLRRMDQSVAGRAAVSAVMATVSSSTEFEVTEFLRRRVVTDQIAVTGTLNLTFDGRSYELSFDDADITAHRSTWHGLQYPFADDTEG